MESYGEKHQEQGYRTEIILKPGWIFFVSIIILEIPFHVLLLYILYFNFISNITPLINKQHNIQVMTMSVFALAASS